MAKKLMALLAAVALAGAAQATWRVNANGIYDSASSTVEEYNGTAYLYFGSLSQNGSDLASSWFNDNKADTVASFATVEVDHGQIFATGNDNFGSSPVVLAIFDKSSGNMFVAATTMHPVGDGDTSDIYFEDLMSASQAAAKEWTEGTTMDTGWYKSAAGSAVPEPTSGLLLLVGGALLALRRRRV